MAKKGNGSSLLARAVARIGEEYKNINVPKDKPDYKGPWDCAEFASWLVYQEAGFLYGCDNNAMKPPTNAQAYTGFWERDAKTLGQQIPIDRAAGIEGAFLLRYPPGPGVMGHIAVSDGKGGTVEAMDTRRGVARGQVSGRRWDTGLLLPDFDYGATTPIDVTPPSRVYAVGMPNMDSAVVSLIQRALNLRGYETGENGTFDRQTAEAVAAFQQASQLLVDGEVGPQTSAALGVSLDAGARAAPAAQPAATPQAAAMLDPLIGIARDILPEIVRTLVGGKTAAVAEKIIGLVVGATGSNDPAVAKAKLAADPAVKATLQAQLAELAMKQEVAKEEARLEAQRIQAAAERSAREKDIEALKLQLSDVQNARGAATQWAAMGGPMAKAPYVVSMIVLWGFIAMLAAFCLLLYWGKDLKPDSGLYQLINIAFGTLAAAFATVVAFWLGSSTGSRAKDAVIIDAEEKRQVAETKAAQVQAQAQAQGQLPPAGARAATKQAAAAASPGGRFQRCMDIVFAKEGGFSDHPDDNGGATLYGVTLQTFRSWRGDNKLTDVDLRKMTKEEATEIYRANYWNAMNCDQLPAGIDLIVFDFGVNAGTGTSARILQKIVGADADGAIGPVTIGATKICIPRDVIIEMSRKKLEYYKGLDDWPTFGKGWTNRTNAIEKASLAMVES